MRKACSVIARKARSYHRILWERAVAAIMRKARSYHRILWERPLAAIARKARSYIIPARGSIVRWT